MPVVIDHFQYCTKHGGRLAHLAISEYSDCSMCRYQQRIEALEAERDRLRYTIDLLNSLVHKLPDKNADLQKEVERVMTALLPGRGDP